MSFPKLKNSEVAVAIADGATGIVLNSDLQTFKNDSAYPDTTDDYAYDLNGNLTSDTNKGISNITYNHLNLPVKIEIGANKIEYYYTASGKKMKKMLTVSGVVTNTDYLDGFQYEKGVLQFFPTAEGYVKNTNFDGANHYNYVGSVSN